MVIDGFFKIGNTTFELTQDTAEEFVNDIKRAIEEARDHNTAYAVLIYDSYEHK